MANQIDSEQAFSGVAQTANIGSSTSVSSGAAKIFREFKWGLLTLFILMTVVVCLVYDGGRGKKKPETAVTKPTLDSDTKQTAGEILPPLGSDTPPTGGVLGTRSATPDRPIAAGSENRDPWSAAENATPAVQPNRSNSNSIAHGTGGHLPEAFLGGDDPVTTPPVTERPSRGGRANTPPKTADAHANGPRSTDRETSAPVAQPTNGAFKWYVVKSGENLTRIANANLPGKGGNRAIMEANKDTLPDANHLKEGMKIRIPNAIGTSASSEMATHGNSVPGAGNRSESVHTSSSKAEGHGDSKLITQDDYIVQTGDTLERIARKVLNDSRKWKELLEWNKDRISEPSKIKVGMVLKTHPSNQMPNTSEITRGRQHTVKAEALPREAETLQLNPPSAEEAQLSIHPIAANTTARKNDKAEPVTKKQEEDDAIVRSVILP